MLPVSLQSLPVFLMLCEAFVGTILKRSCSKVGSVKHTFYGWPDNSPPGAGTAYNCGGRNNIAGGTGTYADPLAMATAPGEFNQCEIIYVPYLQKYVRVEDECDQCTSDWESGNYHIDIWTGSNKESGGQGQITCEDDLTPSAKHTVIRNPSSTLPVDATKLYDVSSGLVRRMMSTTPFRSAITVQAEQSMSAAGGRGVVND